MAPTGKFGRIDFGQMKLGLALHFFTHRFSFFWSQMCHQLRSAKKGGDMTFAEISEVG